LKSAVMPLTPSTDRFVKCQAATEKAYARQPYMLPWSATNLLQVWA